MSRTRVYEFVKQLNDAGVKVTSKDVVDKGAELGIVIKNHLSELEETEHARLKKVFLEAHNQSAADKRVRSTVIRRRRPGEGEPGTPDKAETDAASASAAPIKTSGLVIRRRPASDQGMESKLAEQPTVAEALDEGDYASTEQIEEQSVPAQAETVVEVQDVVQVVEPELPETREESETVVAESIGEPEPETSPTEDAPVEEQPASIALEPTAPVMPTEPAAVPEPPVAEAAVEPPAVAVAQQPAVAEVVAPAAAPPAPAEPVVPQVEPAKIETRRLIVDAPARQDRPGAPTAVDPRFAPRNTAVPGQDLRRPGQQIAVNAPKKERKDEYRAVVISMPEPVATPTTPELPKPVPGLKPSTRDIRKEDGEDKSKRKGKKLIYDRRKDSADGAGFRGGAKGKRSKKKGERGENDLLTPVGPRKFKIVETITVAELASAMSLKVNIVQKKLLELGRFVTVNEALDYDTAAIVASEFGFETENVAFDVTRYLDTEPDKPEDLRYRAPVVTIMGHVDHGKTSLLDRIQKSDIAAGEAGGITQRIGAYVVRLDRDVTGEDGINRNVITFIDTPGHEAFTAMRARGAMVTDIVVLVVAADDGVMPQTLEAISHARAAGVPIIVAVNKIDKPEADPGRIRRQLADHDLAPEEWGGTTLYVDLSARTGAGVDDLLENILLQAEVLDLKANPKKRGRGTVIESRLEKGRGPVATIVVQEGTLKVGDIVVAGTAWGHIRALVDDRGKFVKEAGPACPVEVLGLDHVPPASEPVHVVPDEKTARLVADYREKKDRDERLAKQRKPNLEQLLDRLASAPSEQKSLKVVLKSDTQGAVDAIRQGMMSLSTDRVRLEVIHEGIGNVSENDVNLAQASQGIILGFNVRADAMAKSQADSVGIQILVFNLIHELIDKTKLLMEGKLDMVETKTYIGKAEIRQVFSISKVGKIAGCLVLDGKILRSAHVRLMRDKQEVWTGRLSSLKRFKDDVREVQQTQECGMSLDGFDDLRNGDIVEAYEIVRTAGVL